MQATVIYANNPFHPARNRDVVSIKRKRRISALAPKRSEPFICLVNGKPLLRENNGWNRTVNNKDIVAFITLPQGGGGGGSNPLKTILAITISIYAGPAAAALLGPAAATTTLGGLTFLGSAVAAGITFVGNAIVNALIRDPQPSLSQRSIQAIQASSPTYNISAQGNQARIGQAIPVCYGRNMVYMDFAAQPYTEYSGNEQYLYQLFCIGQGEYDIEQIRLEDSIVANAIIQDGEIYDANGVFEDIEYQVCFNEEITLFPANVVTSVEVSGQESLTFTGTYSQSGTTITVTRTNHGYDTNDAVYLDFTSGSAVDGFFEVVSATDDTFTVTASASLTTSGNVTIVPVLGGFVVNAAGTEINAIGFDVVLPRGLYFANDDGGLSNVTVTYAGQYRQIDDAGAPVGSWITGFSQTVTLATTTPQRFSRQVGVANGRYEARFARTNIKETDTRYGNDVNWAGLRGYIKSNQNYGNLTMLAMKLKASNQLNQTSSRRINVICTRKLPTWNGSAWTNAVVTRNPAWAIADIVTASYGMGLPYSRLDGDQLLALSSVWASRGDTFDGIYDGQQPAWEALTQVARVGRAMPYLQSGNVYVTRDSEEPSPVALFSMRNIAKNSFKMSYLMPNEETADAVDVEYWDNGIFQQKVVRAALNDSTESLVVTRQLFGCSSRDQAYREGMYMAAANRYRRRMVSFQTEMEGYIPTVGDLIAVQHDMPQWGLSGEVVNYDSGTGLVTLSEPISNLMGNIFLEDLTGYLLFEDGDRASLEFSDSNIYYIAFRTRDGSTTDSYEVSLTNNPYQVILNETPSINLDYGIDRERTHFAFGVADSLYVTAKVLGIKPRGLERVEVSCVVDSDFVYTADTGVAPTESAWQLPTRNTRPVLRGLIARSDPADVSKMFLSWEPAAGAERYLIEISDSGNGWTRIGDTSASDFTATAQYGARTVIRVSAIGLTRSAWVSVEYGSSADYMWNVDDTTLMWNVDDTTYMWS